MEVFVGQIFNRWTIKSEPYFLQKYGCNHKHVQVQCECGTIAERRLYEIKTGKIKSCGCIRKLKLDINKKLYNERLKFNISKEELIDLYINQNLTACKIGLKYSVSHHTVVKRLKEHNLYHKDWALIGQRNPRYKGFKRLRMTYWKQILRGAESRNLEVKITIEEAWNQFIKQNGLCAISNLVIFISPSREIKQTASLDRIDSSKGYTLDNIQWIHKDLQRMKMNSSDIDFINWCHIISDFQRAKDKN